MTRVAVMGGAFDPLHYGHLAMALQTIRQGFADEVWLFPSPPRWDKTPVAALERRLRWCHLACGFLRSLALKVHVSEEEIALGDYRGTYYLLCYLKKKHPDKRFLLLLGSDSFVTLKDWRDPTTGERNGEKILQEFEILLVERGNALDESQLKKGKTQKIGRLSELQNLPSGFPSGHALEGLNSTDLREQLSQNKDLNKNWTLPEIAADISTENPYQTSP